MRSSSIIGIIPMVALVVVAGCGPKTEAPPAARSVDNATLGIRLASVPADFNVAANHGENLELKPADPSIGGTLSFSVGAKGEVNLVAAVKAHQQRIEELPGGDYKGGQELMTPLGSAYYSRGRYLGGTTQMEETVVVVLDPGADRLLYLTYRYPAGVDSSVRVQQLLEALGEVEPLSPTARPTGG